MLREVALRALENFAAKPNSEHKNAAVAAFLWRGKAAQQFGARDEAIESWAQGLAVLRKFRVANRNLLSFRDSEETQLQTSLDAILSGGLPVTATWTTLQNLSSDVEKSAWQPVPDAFQFPETGASERSKRDTISHAFVVTTGNLPLAVARTPSLYAALDIATLPRELRMNAQVVGLARENEALWRQKVRVFYASTDAAEQERAEKTGAQFLRVQALFSTILGRENSYSSDRVTTVWISRQSAEWPRTAPADGWNAGAWIDSSADQMMLFRTGEERSPAEWLREIAHEYSHIAFPPFAGFQMPLEPFGNGRLGETILMLWAAQNPSTFFAPDEIDEARKNCRFHVARHAIPALDTWLESDPTKPLSTKGDAKSLNQLIGLALQIERVYGAAVLRRALDEAAKNGYEPWRRNAIEYSMRNTSPRKPIVLRASDLLRAFQNAMKAAPQKTPIWLPGALRHRDANGKNIALTSDELLNHAPLSLKKGESASGWIWFPKGARILEILANTDDLEIRFGSAPTVSANALLKISLVGKSGWQKLSLRASGDIAIGSAQFEG